MEFDDVKFSVVGLKQVMRGLDADELETVYLADDTDLSIRNKIMEKARECGVPIVHIPNMRMLGDAAGIDVKAAVAGVAKAEEAFE